MKPSLESTEEQKQWTEIEDLMTKMLSTIKDRRAPNVAMARNSDALLKDISADTDRLRSSAREISKGISAAIEAENRALGDESNRLSAETCSVQRLEAHVADLRRSQAEMLAQRRSAEQAIPLHTAVASEQVAELDEIQSKHVRKLPKIKQELSLHALMTNIKWDYSRREVLAGEVSMPASSAHRRFVIEKDSLSDFEIAEKLWENIGG